MQIHSVLALRQVSLDVFDGHRGVIHQDADGQSQPAQGHEVNGLVQRAQHEDGDQNRERNGDGNDQSAAPTPQEQQNHQRGQAGGNQTFAKHSLHRRPHEN
jgi:hypothetical protein